MAKPERTIDTAEGVSAPDNGSASGSESVGWYLREDPRLPNVQLWRVNESIATRMDVTNAEAGPGSHFEAAQGEDVWACIERQTGWLTQGGDGRFVRLDLSPGRFHPRMARPIASISTTELWLPDLETQRKHVTSAQSQLIALTRQLEAICRVVEPTPRTLDVHGHEIRNLLILAATEVEMHWRGVLRANGNDKDSFRTADYVALADPMRLREFTISFHRFPELTPTRPFGDWGSSAPTRSLGWYAAYNSVKHNREVEFASATLGNALDALSASVVLLVAQFGSEALSAELSSFFDVSVPEWPLEACYVASHMPEGWRAQPHPALIG